MRSDIEAERLAVAAGKLGRAARIFDGTVGKISAVPRPPHDASHLAKWFGYLKLQKSYLGRAATALRAENASPATSTTPCSSSTTAISPTTW